MSVVEDNTSVGLKQEELKEGPLTVQLASQWALKSG
jgi:hypothetical protein